MKNPCEDNCILRVVCTEACDAKKNYEALLSNAIEVNSQVLSRHGRGRIGISSNYGKYTNMKLRHNAEMTRIRSRKQRKEGGNV